MIPPVIEPLLARGEIGGRTVQILDNGEVECHDYPLTPLADDQVRVRTVRSAISPGTEMTFYGRGATNVYLHKHWNEELRLFEAGAPSLEFPLPFGYRAAGEVVDSRSSNVPAGTRVFGSWRHTEFASLSAAQVSSQKLPDELSWDDAVDLAQMAPICLNGVAYAEGQQVGSPAVVFGAGPVGLITAQLVRHTGASPVYLVDRIASRLAVAAELGLEPVDASAESDVAVLVKRRHGAAGIPVAFECTGSTGALHEAIRVVRRRGVVVALGFYQGEGRGLVLGDEFHHNGIEIRCGQIGNIHPSTSMEELRTAAIGLACSGELVLGGLPRLTLPVERVADGFAALTRPAEVLQVALAYGAT